MNGNMELWERVCETPPEHTKQVNQRGGFTAIDAHYQVMRATELFGPVGQGWGYKVEHSTIETDIAIDSVLKRVVLAVADVSVWHGVDDQLYGPWRGCEPIVAATGRVDTDAPKKATTDALTKALSHIGIGADVFLGLYDDNKYVDGLKAKFEKPVEMVSKDQTKAIQTLVKKIYPDIDKDERIKKINAWLTNAYQGHKSISSTKELTKAEATKFIDVLSKQVGE